MHTLGAEGDNSITNTGMYVQGTYDLDKFFVTARYGIFTPDLDGADDITRITPGAGYRVSDNCELRFEYQMNEVTDVDDDDLMFLQLVVAF